MSVIFCIVVSPLCGSILANRVAFAYQSPALSLSQEVDDALDCGNQDKQREMLNQVENDARTAPYLLVAKVGHGAFGEVYRGYVGGR